MRMSVRKHRCQGGRNRQQMSVGGNTRPPSQNRERRVGPEGGEGGVEGRWRGEKVQKVVSNTGRDIVLKGRMLRKKGTQHYAICV